MGPLKRKSFDGWCEEVCKPQHPIIKLHPSWMLKLGKLEQKQKAESSIHVKTTTSSDLGNKFCGRLISLVLFLLQLLMTIIVAVFSISSLQYTTYKIPKNNSDSFPFVFNDIMGLEPKNGVLVDDVKLALRGHMKEGYRVKLLQPFKICLPQKWCVKYIFI